MSALPYQPIGSRIGEYDLGSECLGLFEVHTCIRYYYQYVTHRHLTCRRTVNADTSATALALYHIGLEERSPLLLFTMLTFSPAIMPAPSMRSSSMVMLPT